MLACSFALKMMRLKMTTTKIGPKAAEEKR